MPQLSVHFTFNGQCQEALEFYHQCFGGDLYLQTVGESTDLVFPHYIQDRILHARLTTKQLIIMASDLTDETLREGNRIAVWLHCDSQTQLQYLFHKLSEDAIETKVPKRNGSGHWMGVVKDRYHIQWLLHHPGQDNSSYPILTTTIQ